MNKSFKDFLLLSLLSIGVLLSILAVLSYIYRFSSLSAYEFALAVIMLTVIAVTFILSLSTTAVFYAYNRKKVGAEFIWLHKTALKVLLPFISFLAGLIKYSKDDIRRFYVDVNNIIVQSGDLKYPPDKVLILLPHCLQNSSCEYKITSDIRNCKRCGKCCIGEIVELTENTGVQAVVATGGTLARSVIAASKPEFVLSVACERDLTSGISDIWNLPVVGVLNERPMGPCRDTTVNVKRIKENLNKILDK